MEQMEQIKMVQMELAQIRPRSLSTRLQLYDFLFFQWISCIFNTPQEYAYNSEIAPLILVR